MKTIQKYEQKLSTCIPTAQNHYLWVPAFVIQLAHNNNENESNMKLNCSLLSGCENLAMI